MIERDGPARHTGGEIAAAQPRFGAISSGLGLGWFAFALALIGCFGLRETFHDDLDYVEL